MPEQANLFFLNNQNLFSKNYLEHRLPNTDLWKEQKEKVSDVFDVIKKAYGVTKTLKLGPGEEAVLANKFIEPVLSALGYTYIPQPNAQRGIKKQRPDYALFKDDVTCKAARKFKDNLDQYFSQSLTLLEAKYWGRRLNDTDKKDVLDSRDPTAQTVKYLDSVNYHTNGKINWAILTNGKFWRLFYFRASSRSGNYFEIDLEEIITRNDKEKFLYFYLFFARDAFIPDSVSGKTWLDQHLKGTEDYAARISTKLKDLIFDKVFEGLAEGFVHYRKDNPPIPPLAKGGEGGFWKETDESKKAIFRGCLTLLYRLLFVLYAESRNLLPVNEDAYYIVSLSKLRRDINSDISVTGLDKMSRRSYTYWARLQGLFDIIAKGDPALNVPVYNGGLFETPKDSFLSIHKLPDPFLADAIELLTVDHEGIHAPDAPAFIDYSSLSVRHLGDIYEGILEFHIQVAEGDVVEIRKDGKSLWEKASAIKEGIRIYGKRTKGEVYIENSRHERKATGSFYTPHFSVEYIVGNTVGPVLNEKLKIADGLLSQFASMQKKSLNNQLSADSIRGYKAKIRELEDEIFKTVFGIKVLDPAMGSGHFLVHTVDYISDRIIAFLAGYPDNPVIKKIAELRNEILEEISKQGVKIDESKLTEVNLIKRMVMKRCIYGVDLNEMAVELAKLSLWLDSFTLGAPLSFLDHHLKCGNSLIGVLDIATVIPVSEIFLEYQRALSFMIQVSELTDATISEAKKSYDLYSQGQKAIEPIRRRFNVATAKYFMDIGTSLKRVEQLATTLDFDKESYTEIVEKCKRALQIAEEKKFFHWRLEFPEGFYTIRGEIENPGFDCVVGNPPYLNVEEISSDAREFLMSSGSYSTTIKRMDIFIPFHELSIKLLRNNGKHSFIVPFPLLTQDYGQELRLFFLANTKIEKIVDLSKYKIFPDAVVKNIIPLFEKQTTDTNYLIEVITQDEDPNKIQEIKGSIKLIDASQFKDTYKNMFRIDLIPEYHKIQKKIDSVALKFGEIFAASWGARGVPVEKFHLDTPINNHCKKMVKGSDIARYNLLYSGKWLLYDVGKLYRPSMPEFFENPKIVFQEVTGQHGLIGVYDAEKFYTDHSLICCIPKYCFEDYDERKLRKHKIYIYEDEIENSKRYNILYALALMNSQANGFYFSKFIGYDLNVYPENIEYLPIPSISFTSPEKERKEFFREAVKLYKGSKYEDIKKWAEYELSMGRNDTIHDFLAYLAEQMIEMNKTKNEESKGFLKWLEREIGAGIEDLSNKTAIKEYHEHDFNHFLEVLKKNKNKLTIDPSGRKTQEASERHFNDSISKLLPLKNKISATDSLIDQIVYKLYNLTPEEIAIVGGAR